jgi:hypothetical protein
MVDQIQKTRLEARQYVSEKVAVAEQAYAIVDSVIKRLDVDLAVFESYVHYLLCRLRLKYHFFCLFLIDSQNHCLLIQQQTIEGMILVLLLLYFFFFCVFSTMLYLTYLLPTLVRHQVNSK